MHANNVRDYVRRALSLTVLPLLTFTSTHTAWAAPANDAATDEALSEVLVSASKRGEQSVQDTPFSVQAIGKETLQEQNILEFADYFRKVPGLTMWEQGPGDKRFIIRGVNTQGAASVGVYFDEVVITGENADNGGGRQLDIKLFDVDHVEVLRGPQGTTFGSSSMTGTIRILPTQPDFTEYQFGGGAGISSTKNSSGLSYKADAAINIPLIQDKLALRVSGLKVDGAGYIDTRFRKDDNNENTDAYRAILSWKVIDDLTFSAMAMRQTEATNDRPFYNSELPIIVTNPNFTGGPVSGFYNVNLSRAGFDDRANLYNAKLIYAKDWGTITATYSMFNRHALFDRDSSVALEVLSAGALKADGAGRSIISQTGKRELRTAELRFASSWQSAWQVLAGAFYQQEDRTLVTTIYQTDAITGRRAQNSLILFGRGAAATIDQKAAFAELSYKPLDKLTLTAGGRYVNFNIASQDSADFNFGGSPGPGPGPALSETESKPTFKFNASYDFTPDLLGYAQVAQGFRSGGANNTAAGALVGVVIPSSFKSDNLVNYELGAKSAWLGGRLTANGASYFINWSNIQTVAQAVAPSGVQVPYQGNAGTAHIYGAELELNARITRAFDVSLNLNAVRARYTEDFPDPAAGRSGDKIPYVPDFTSNLEARYQYPLGSSKLNGFAGGDVSYTSSQGSEVRPTDFYYRKIGAYSLVNLRTGIEGADWSAVLELQNAFDDSKTISYVFDFRGGTSGLYPDGLVRPWPRTIALNFRKNFTIGR
jgi:iron complex outermembrane receptor protein